MEHQIFTHRASIFREGVMGPNSDRVLVFGIVHTAASKEGARRGGSELVTGRRSH